MRKVNQGLKDNLVLLLFCYCIPFLFWYEFHDSIYSRLDWFVFVVALCVMFVYPIIVFEYRFRKVAGVG